MKQLALQKTRRLAVALWLALMTLMVVPEASAYNFVTLSEGALSFSPGTLVTPIVGAAVAAVVAGAVLYVLWIGVRAIKKFAKG